MSSIENLRIGDVIMATSSRYQDENVIPPPWEGEYQPEIRPISTTPLLVVSIDAPFVLGEQLIVKVGEPMIIDSRFVSWTKVSKRFVREYCRMAEITLHQQFRSKSSDKSTEAKTNLCPLCGTKMSDRLSASKEWRLTCRSCQVELVPLSGVKS
jgi:hypothetical protein